MLKRYASVVLLAILLLTNLSALAQTQQEKIDLQAIEKIKEEGMKRSQVMEILSYMTDVHGPRLTNSPHERAAQEWAKNKLSSWGLQNAKLEQWGEFGRGWSLEGFTANMTKPHFSPLIAYPKAWSPGTAGTVRGPVVYLDAKTAEDLEKYKGKLKGAIVLLAPPREVRPLMEPLAKRESNDELMRLANAEPPTGRGDGRRRFDMSPEQQLNARKWQLVHSEGAAVVLEPSSGLTRADGGTIFVGSVTLPAPADASFANRPRAFAKDAPQAVPQAVMTVEHYNRIIRMIEKGAAVELEVSIAAKFYDQDLQGYNVIAEIPGTDPVLKDEIVMLGGHYDSWHAGTGATDNAAGCAVMMEAVRILQTLGLKPRRTIRIALWSGEEQGLLGSRGYVANHFAKRVDQGGQAGAPQSARDAVPQFDIKPAHGKFSAYFNLDNGTGKIRGIYLQGNDLVRPIFQAWFAPFKDLIGTSKENNIATLSLSNTGGTDHLAFDGVGLPGFQFIQDPIEYDTRTHHSNMDVYDRIQAEDMKQAATIIAAFVYNTAMRDEKLPRKPMPGQPFARAGQ